MKGLNKPIVTKDDIKRLENFKADKTKKRGLEESSLPATKRCFKSWG
jgi:hypothetical protein